MVSVSSSRLHTLNLFGCRRLHATQASVVVVVCGVGGAVVVRTTLIVVASQLRPLIELSGDTLRSLDLNGALGTAEVSEIRRDCADRLRCAPTSRPSEAAFLIWQVREADLRSNCPKLKSLDVRGRLAKH